MSGRLCVPIIPDLRRTRSLTTVPSSILRRHSLCAMGRTNTAREGPRGPGPGFCRRQRYSRIHPDSAVPPHRKPQVINFKARLVGNEGLLSNNGRIEGSARISSDSAMRCNNCPSRGCANCPMCVRQRDAACNLCRSPRTHKWSRPLFLFRLPAFASRRYGVGGNPEYVKKKMKKEKARKERARKQELEETTKGADL